MGKMTNQFDVDKQHNFALCALYRQNKCQFEQRTRSKTYK